MDPWVLCVCWRACCLWVRQDKRTLFNGSLVTLDTRANMVTDMLKLVVQQKIAPVELVYKASASEDVSCALAR